MTPARSRRSFLQQLSAFGLAATSTHSLAAQAMQGMAMPASSASTAHPAPPSPRMLHSLELPPFVDELPLPRVLAPHPHRPLRIAMREVHAQVHRDLPPTRLWSYSDTALAPLIEARTGRPLQVEWINHLPPHHFLPVDYSLHGCGRDLPEVRACVHLHGAKAPSADDGQPGDWYARGHSRLCTYPLQQDATALWYHDHAMGLNRLNIYAGLFGQLLLRDAAEDALHLPHGPYEIPLTLVDRNFTADAQLFYPTSGDPDHPWVSEFAGDAILLNGKIRPFLTVEPRLYRFRLLNAANSRFFALSLTDRRPFHQIGSDQGLLAAPVPLTNLNLAPAERADLLLDFTSAAGERLHLRNGALDILQFRVGSTPAAARGYPSTIPARLRELPAADPTSATVTRTITLNDHLDRIGNSMIMTLNRKRWHEPVTEQPRLDATEIWEFVNLTEDTHPMHLHLVRFQILDRRVFDVFAYENSKGLHYLDTAQPPQPNELGWKDTVQCPPGLVTRILVRFEGYTGKYLYHCHILEHEANDMMRPFEVLA